MAFAPPFLALPGFDRSAGQALRLSQHRFGRWQLTVRQDAFTGVIFCQLRAPRMSYEHGAVLFRFTAQTDTAAALYKVDGGPATPWRANAMTLAAQGLSLQDDSIENPSRGIVAAPGAILARASMVSVRVDGHSRPQTFALAGLDAALTAARVAGCGPELLGAKPG